ncbi:MAG: hypothetical protein ABW321_17300 [Polyangiales bacterium]
MKTKMWQGVLWAAALSACTDQTPLAPQPTAAAGNGVSASAGTGSVAVPSAGTGSLPAAGGGGTGNPVGASAGSSAAGRPAPADPDLDDAGSGETPVGNPNVGGPAPVSGEVALTTDLVIPAGSTMTVGPGATFKASPDVKVQVLGELIVKGSSESPAVFAGGGMPRSWHGIVVEAGGKLTLEHAQISGATYGLFIMPGAEFSVDSSVIDTSFKAAVVQSNGSFTRTRFVATVPETVSLASEVTVDDPNGALTIMDASPTITDCRFDGASALTDLVRIGGNASPTFDHVYLHDAHCAFHTFGGTNTSARITHARIENFPYGFMAYTTKPIVEDSVFINNGADFGICLGATEDNAPALRNNFYSGGEVLLDASCFGLGINDPSPAGADDPSIGTVSKF